MKFPRLNEIDWPRTILLIVAILATVSAVVNWFRPATQITTQQLVPVPQIVEKKIEVPGPVRIKIVEKEVAEKKLPGLKVLDGSNVLTTGEMPPTRSGYITAAVQDAEGNTILQAKEKPLPLFGFPNEREVGIRYGLATRTGPEGQLFARWQFLRAGNIHVGGYGEISTRPDAKVMLEAAYRF